MYNYYRVRGAAVKIQAHPTGTDSTAGVQQCIATSITSWAAATPTSLDMLGIMEANYARGYLDMHWKIFNRTVSSQPLQYHRKKYWNMDKIKQRIYSGGYANPSGLDMYTAFGASPSDFPIYFNIGSGDVEASSGENVTVPCIIRIVYYVELIDPRYFDAS